MGTLLYLAGPLGCAAMMAAMMWLMRGHRAAADSQYDGSRDEIAASRAEVAALRAGPPPPAGQQRSAAQS